MQLLQICSADVDWGKRLFYTALEEIEVGCCRGQLNLGLSYNEKQLFEKQYQMSSLFQFIMADIFFYDAIYP